jgi:ubiquinone/menaquinone biosynthesis C-methylase UbiE
MGVPAEGIYAMSSENFWKYFFEIYEAIPRQGPGHRESTERAAGLIPSLTSSQRILDIGCGSGAQTIDLAQVTEAQIVAVDKHAPFISQLVRRVAKRGLGDRITAQIGDMNDLSFADGSFDVIWAEGSIFIMGFDQGLSAWRRLLKPGGYMIVSDFCWCCDNPPAELQEIFLDGNPDVGDVEVKRKAIADNGYRLVSDFMLPEAGWWENFYVPLGESLERFRTSYVGNPEALEVASTCQYQIDMHKKHVGACGYGYFVIQRDESNT